MKELLPYHIDNRNESNRIPSEISQLHKSSLFDSIYIKFLKIFKQWMVLEVRIVIPLGHGMVKTGRETQDGVGGVISWMLEIL